MNGLKITPEQPAKLFHETYERLAPEFGYATRKETAIPWDAIPEDSANKRLMIAVCREVMDRLIALKKRDIYPELIAMFFPNDVPDSGSHDCNQESTG